MLLPSHGVQLRVGLLLVVVLRHQIEEASSLLGPLLLPLGEVVLPDLSHRIINNGTYEEGRIDNIDIVPLDQLKQCAK